ncbi:hydroxyethylthiazole kinase family domain-containing protein [Ditylenchus destructor]|nr:hydroxyethylthiazole kinase family domain-containing protein [Ditylenchus destructor]
MLTPTLISTFAKRVHAKSPLIHCLTNQVAANFSANVLLAIGATPCMVVAHEEVNQFTTCSADALSVNLGTLTRYQATAIDEAIKCAEDEGKRWVLDPVAVGPLMFRTEFCVEQLAVYGARPTVIRGNASEIVSLMEEIDEFSKYGFKRDQDIDDEKQVENMLRNSSKHGRGPDASISSKDAIEHAQKLAQQTSSIVIMTGDTDYIVNPRDQQTLALSNGSSQMTRTTGIGCALSDTVAAFVAVAESEEEVANAAAAAVAHSTIAGQLAAEGTKGKPGSFAVAYLDRLASLETKDYEILKSKVLS